MSPAELKGAVVLIPHCPADLALGWLGTGFRGGLTGHEGPALLVGLAWVPSPTYVGQGGLKGRCSQESLGQSPGSCRGFQPAEDEPAP